MLHTVFAGVGCPALSSWEPSGYRFIRMDRNPKFEDSRYLGDKRTQLVYDLDVWEDEEVIDEIVLSGVATSFAPDTLPEARNRCYTLATPGTTRMRRRPRA